MSYLTLPSGPPSFSKAVISLWFRIPQEAIDAAGAEFDAAFDVNNPDSDQYGFGWRGTNPSGVVNHDHQPPQMAGIIPLLIFGQPGSEANVDFETQTFGSWTVSYYYWQYIAFPVGVWILSNSVVNDTTGQVGIAGSKTWKTEPSYIGVWCTKDPQRALLAVNLETGGRATITGGGLILVDHTVMDRAFYEGPTDQMPLRTWGQTFTYGGDPGIFYPRTESFRTHPLAEDLERYDGTSGTSPAFGITVTPDEWHHLLLSFDLTIPCRTHGVSTNDSGMQAAAFNASSPSVFTDSAPKMWIAYDDENKKGRDLSYYCPAKGASGSFLNPPEPDKPDSESRTNEILSHNGWRIAGAYCSADSTDTVPAVPPQTETYVQTITGLDAAGYNYTPSALPTNAPMGLPGTSELVDHIHHVEMAEFQMFLDVTLDTSDENSRRAFVDKHGKPVPPTQKQSVDADGNVTGDSGSIELLGKKPEVMLRGQSNWIKGYNTGSTGVDQDGKKIDGGQFEPTAKIKKYKPSPELGK